MLRRRISILFFIFFGVLPVGAQTLPKFTLTGNVRDIDTGEELIGATIIIKEIATTGTSTNAYGFYSITLPEGNYRIVSQYVGYESQEAEVALHQNVKLDFNLLTKASQLTEVVVSSERENEKTYVPSTGVEKLNLEEISRIPVIWGERDIIKSLQLLPGVKSSTEGSSGLFVRGGGADQNLILLDEAPVYNASHLMGFFSVFNPDALKDVTLYKGNIPAEYGGRLSSVLDVKMKEGNNQKFGIDAGIGLIASRLTLQGPLKKDKGSFMISARRTYADLFLKLSGYGKNTQLYFYDLNAKTNYRLNENNRIFLSGYFGKDYLNLSEQYYLNWGNNTGTFRWNHLFNEKLFSNTSFIYSQYSYQTANNPGGNLQFTTSKIQDYHFKQDFEYFPADIGTIKFGIQSIYHTIHPSTLTSVSGVESTDLKLQRYAWENALYGSHEFEVSDQLAINYGVRLTAFSLLGPGDYFTISQGGEITDTLKYTNRTFIKTYFNVEPRIVAAYVFGNESSVKASLSRTTQNLHLLSNSNFSEPTDLWLPSSEYIKPEIADQISFGYFRNIQDNMYEFSTEVYYKKLQNQIDLRDGAQIEANTNVEKEVLSGKGRAFGLEILIKKKKGEFTGWIGYTISRTERQISQINNGKYYPARQDRLHDLSIVGIYQFNSRWSFSANWVYYTGNAATFPSGKYEINGQTVNYYTERNGYRLPAYHRLDIGATFQRKKTKKFESSWTFSLYNAYGRENPFLITFQESKDDPKKTEAVQTSLFRFVPSFTYNIKF